MKAQNAKQRNDLFFQWSLMFVITVAIVAVAIFFDYDFKNRVNESNVSLRNENKKLTSSNNKGEELNIVNNLIAQIKSHENPDASITNIKSNVLDGVSNLRRIETDSTSKKLNSLLAICLTTWNDDKERLVKINKDLITLNNELKKCNDDLKDYKEDLKNLRLKPGCE